MSDAELTAYSRSAVFPIPASPCISSVRLSPARTAAITSSRRAHSDARPRRLSGSSTGSAVVIWPLILIRPAWVDLYAAPGADQGIRGRDQSSRR
jgi:hypothetical protein